MKRTTKHVGLDVHQATTIAVVREDTGRIIHQSVLPTEATAICEFFRGMRGTIRVAFEEGTQAQWLHDLLVPLVSEVIVCDRRGASQQGNKGDYRDAAGLSDLLRQRALRAVYHGTGARAQLQELVRTYQQVVDDSTRVMARLKALFRGRAIRTTGRRVYATAERAAWLAQLTEPGARFRATVLYAQLEVLQALRPQAKGAMVAEAQRDPAWPVLRSIPFLGPVRVAVLLATLQTPWRFRTKRQLWGYAGLAVVTRTSAEYEFAHGRPVRRQRAPMTRGLNRNHNRFVKVVFKSAAQVASAKPGPLQDFYQRMVNDGMREEPARVTLARKLAAVTLRLWKTGELYEPSQLSVQQVAAR